MVDHPIDRYISSAQFVFLRFTPVSLLEREIGLAVLLAVESEPTLSSQFFKPPAGAEELHTNTSPQFFKPPAGAEELHTNMEGDDMVIRKPGEIYGLVQTLILLAVTQPKLLCIAHIIASSIMYCNWNKTGKQGAIVILRDNDRPLPSSHVILGSKAPQEFRRTRLKSRVFSRAV